MLHGSNAPRAPHRTKYTAEHCVHDRCAAPHMTRVWHHIILEAVYGFMTQRNTWASPCPVRARPPIVQARRDPRGVIYAYTTPVTRSCEADVFPAHMSTEHTCAELQRSR
eukprot:scaffold30832_cov67-Phaeocystis_antarctica.AAC.10